MNNDAWLFIATHQRVIHSVINRLDKVHQDRDDLVSDLQLRIAERFETYDPQRSSPSTWIWYQGRAVISTRRRKSRLWRQVKADSKGARHDEPIGTRILASQTEAEQRADIAAALSQATVKQAAALRSLYLGHGKRETREHLGVSMTTRDKRIKQFRAQLGHA